MNGRSAHYYKWPDVISSSTSKAKLFASILTSNSMLYDKGQSLRNSPSLTENNLSKIPIRARKIPNLIKCLDAKLVLPNKTKNKVVVFTNINPEISSFVAMLSNLFLKTTTFPRLWNISSVCPVFMNAGDRSSLSHYRPISLFSGISKLIDAIINMIVVEQLDKNNLLSYE